LSYFFALYVAEIVTKGYAKRLHIICILLTRRAVEIIHQFLLTIECEYHSFVIMFDAFRMSWPKSSSMMADLLIWKVSKSAW